MRLGCSACLRSKSTPGFQSLCLHTRDVTRSRKPPTFWPQQSFNRGNILLGKEKTSAKPTKSWFSALRPALTFIFSPSLQHHYNQFPWGTSLIFHLSGICRKFFCTFLIVRWEFGFKAEYLFALKLCQWGWPKGTPGKVQFRALGWDLDWIFQPRSFQNDHRNLCL